MQDDKALPPHLRKGALRRPGVPEPFRSTLSSATVTGGPSEALSSDDDDDEQRPFAPGSLAARLASGKRSDGQMIRLGNTAHRADVRYLKELMDGLREFVHARQAEDNAAYNEKRLPDWRTCEGVQTARGVRSIEDLMNSDAEMISYEAFADMSHHESMLSTLGAGGLGWNDTFLRWSNYNVVTFEHMYHKMDELLAPVISETELFALRPEQRLAIAEALARYPQEMHCKVNRLSSSYNVAINPIGLPPGTRPTIKIVNYCTGNGKTLMAMTIAMTEVCDPGLWQQCRDSWKRQIWTNSTMENLGLVECPHLDEQEMARVVIAFIPEQLLDQWEKTARALNEAMVREKGVGFEIWRGLSVLKRKSNHEAGRTRTLRAAHEHTKQTGRAMLWLVPAKTAAAWQTLRDAPELAFPTRIYDEMSTSTEPRNAARESRPLRNIICQATVERLEKATAGQPRHPLRLALQHEVYNSTNEKHAAIFHMLSAPDWLRLLVCRGMGPTMPSGLRKLHLKIRVQSLAGNILKSDLTITGLDELLKTMLRNVGGDCLTPGEHKNMIERCHRLLGNVDAPGAAAAEEDDRPMYEKLKAAEKEVSDDYDSRPPEPKPQDYPNNNIPQQVWDDYQPIFREKRALNAMRRMFERLAESVCMDPPPECPIGLDPIPPEHVALFPCCTNVFDRRNKDCLSDLCPMCRAPLTGGLLVASNALDVLQGKSAAAKKAPAAAAPAEEEPEDTVGNEDFLISTLKKSAAEEKFSGSIKAVVSTIKTFLKYRPQGARILLAFACDGDERRATTRTRGSLAKELPDIQSIESVGGERMSAPVRNFVVENDSNRILLINTNDRSLSLEGLDLWNAQLIIMDKLNPGYLSPANMVQAIGRIMRPQYEAYIPGTGGGSAAERLSALGLKKARGYPAKWIVLLEKDTGEQPAAQEAVPAADPGGHDGEEEWEQLPDMDADGDRFEPMEEEWEQPPEGWLENDDPADHGAGVGL